MIQIKRFIVMACLALAIGWTSAGCSKYSDSKNYRTAKDPNEALDVREIAAYSLTDPALLADIAKNEKEPTVRAAAVSRLTLDFPNSALFADLAKNDEDYNVRVLAVGVSTDPALLVDIAKNDVDWRVRVCAIIAMKDVLTDPAPFVDLAKHDEDWHVRRAAVRLGPMDPATLAEIAENDENSDVREAAERRLADLVEQAN